MPASDESSPCTKLVLGDLDREPETDAHRAPTSVFSVRVQKSDRASTCGDTLTAIENGFCNAAHSFTRSAMLIEHEPGDRHDAARALRHRNELTRRHEPARLHAPTDERFDAADATRRDLDLRLKVDLELALLHGALEIASRTSRARPAAASRPAGRCRTRARSRELPLARAPRGETASLRRRRATDTRRCRASRRRGTCRRPSRAPADDPRSADRGVHDGRHRVDVDQHREATARTRRMIGVRGGRMSRSLSAYSLQKSSQRSCAEGASRCD